MRIHLSTTGVGRIGCHSTRMLHGIRFYRSNMVAFIPAALVYRPVAVCAQCNGGDMHLTTESTGRSTFQPVQAQEWGHRTELREC